MAIATHSPVFKCLSKSRIAAAEARLARLRKIPSLTFLRYCNYCRLGNDWRDSWGYHTRANGDVSYGNLKKGDCPDFAESYLRALSTDDTDSGEAYFYVPFASGSDQSGSLVERSNYNVFIEEFGKDNEWVFSAYGGFGTYAAVVGLTGLLTCEEDTADSIFEVLEGLKEYALIDEEAYSELCMEKANEAWDSYVADDFRDAVEKRFDGCAAFEWPSNSDLRAAFEQFAEKANCCWEDEGWGQDNMYIDIRCIVESIDLNDLADYVIRYVVSYIDVGEEKEGCATESEAIERVDKLRAAGFLGASYAIVLPVKD